MTIGRKDAGWLIDILLNEANLLSRKNTTIERFYTNLIRKYPELGSKVLDFLVDGNSLYPLVSYVLWRVVLPVLAPEVAVVTMYDTYRRQSWRDLWWYERCICLTYLSKHTAAVVESKSMLNDLIKRIDDQSESMNELERRASIVFLSAPPDRKGENLLKNKFGQVRDLNLLRHLQAT